MRVVLKTEVDQSMEKVFRAFDQKLFSYLLPPGAKLLRFDGSKKGDIVQLKLPLAGEWISKITEDYESENKCYFIDQGVKLPFPIKKWTHQHIIHKAENNRSIIEDNMEYSSGFKLLDVLIYPFLYAAFAPRKKQYKSYFATQS